MDLDILCIHHGSDKTKHLSICTMYKYVKPCPATTTYTFHLLHRKIFLSVAYTLRVLNEQRRAVCLVAR